MIDINSNFVEYPAETVDVSNTNQNENNNEIKKSIYIESPSFIDIMYDQLDFLVNHYLKHFAEKRFIDSECDICKRFLGAYRYLVGSITREITYKEVSIKEQMIKRNEMVMKCLKKGG